MVVSGWQPDPLDRACSRYWRGDHWGAEVRSPEGVMASDGLLAPPKSSGATLGSTMIRDVPRPVTTPEAPKALEPPPGAVPARPPLSAHSGVAESTQAPSALAVPVAVVVPTNGTAVAAMVVGLVSFALGCAYGIGLLGSPVAWYLGARAKREIAASGGRQQGSGQATAGLVLGVIGTILLALGVVALLWLLNAVNDAGY